MFHSDEDVEARIEALRADFELRLRATVEALTGILKTERDEAVVKAREEQAAEVARLRAELEALKRKHDAAVRELCMVLRGGVLTAARVEVLLATHRALGEGPP
jgi:chorismate-pyruvate lyase